MNQPTAMYDFSLECSKFRERLLTDFLKCAENGQAIPLSDDALSLLSAAGGAPPKESVQNTGLPVSNTKHGFVKQGES